MWEFTWFASTYTSTPQYTYRTVSYNYVIERLLKVYFGQFVYWLLLLARCHLSTTASSRVSAWAFCVRPKRVWVILLFATDVAVDQFHFKHHDLATDDCDSGTSYLAVDSIYRYKDGQSSSAPYGITSSIGGADAYCALLCGWILLQTCVQQ